MASGWVDSMGVVIRSYINNPHIYPLLLYLFFFAAASLLFVHLKKCFSFLFRYFLVIKFYVLNTFSRSINTHKGDYRRPTAAI